MGARASDETPTLEAGTDDLPEAPPLRAEVFVYASEPCRARVRPLVPDEVTLREFGNADALADAASGNLALVLGSAHCPDSRLEAAVHATLRANQYARVGMIAADGEPLLRCDVPHDDAYVLPGEREALRTGIKHLYIRAYYSVTLERFYEVSLAIENHERAPGETDAEQLQTLRESRERFASYLKLFRGFLDAEDFDSIAKREERFDALFESDHRRGNPDIVGLPDACPDCKLDWTGWHGPRLGVGYEQIGANTYRCAACGHTLADNDPDNYQVG